MSMVSVSLEPSMYFDVTDLNQRSETASCAGDNGVDGTDDDDDDDDEINLTFGCSSLNPLDTRQYLYKLIPKKEYAVEHRKMVRWCIMSMKYYRKA